MNVARLLQLKNNPNNFFIINPKLKSKTMKKVMLIALAGMFSMTMFAQTQDKAKPAEKKKEPVSTEAVKPAQPAAKETAKPATREAKKPAAKPAHKKAAKKDEAKPAK